MPFFYLTIVNVFIGHNAQFACAVVNDHYDKNTKPNLEKPNHILLPVTVFSKLPELRDIANAL